MKKIVTEKSNEREREYERERKRKKSKRNEMSHIRTHVCIET